MAPASAPEPVTVGAVTLVMLSVLDAPLSDAAAKSGADGAFGAVVSTVTLSDADVALVLPAMSVSLAVSVCVPLLKVELTIDQLPLASAIAVPSTAVPLVS